MFHHIFRTPEAELIVAFAYRVGDLYCHKDPSADTAELRLRRLVAAAASFDPEGAPQLRRQVREAIASGMRHEYVSDDLSCSRWEPSDLERAALQLAGLPA